MRSAIPALLVAATAIAGCSKDDGNKAEPKAVSAEETTKGEAAGKTGAAGEGKTDGAAVVAQVGVEPGPVEHKEGSAAVLKASKGTVEIRRLGEETFAAAKNDQALYPGDQVRAGAGASATVVLADSSTIEIAETSTVAIGSRLATADPASSAAVLVGVARFSVAERSPGEGPFVVFVPAGVIATKATAFTVGVAADGDARVGVEAGAVAVAGLVALDKPVELEASNAVELSAQGEILTPTPWTSDDWATWRGQAEADIEVAAAVDAHAKAMNDLAAQLNAAYAELEALGKQVASFEAEASAKASAGDTAGYQNIAVDGAVAIDASFLTALRLEALTHAYEGRAAITTDLYVRHPDVVVWADVAPEVSAAVLWPKRFDLTAAAYLEPLRLQYYVHHPRGRINAELVGVAVPEFYAKVSPPELPSVRGKVKVAVFTPPVVVATVNTRPVWVTAPSLDWKAKAKVQVAPPRGAAAFWVHPPDLKATALLGADIKAKVAPVFAVRAAVPRADVKLGWGVDLGGKIKVAPPDLKAAARARASYQLGVPAVDVRGPDVKAGVRAKVGGDVAVPDVRGGINARAKVVVPDVKAKVKVVVPDVRAKIKVGGDAAARARADLDAKAKAGASVKVKAPQVKIKAPSVKVKAGVKASGGFKIGN